MDWGIKSLHKFVEQMDKNSKNNSKELPPPETRTARTTELNGSGEGEKKGIIRCKGL